MRSLYDTLESILDDDKKVAKDINKTTTLALHPYLAKGKKQRLDWRDLKDEAYKFNGNSSKKTPEYLKFICDNFVDRVLWKYFIIYDSTITVDIKMGYSDTPAKRTTVWYKFKNKKIGFSVNTYFRDIFLTIKLIENGKESDVTSKVMGGYISEVTVENLFCDKKGVEKFKKFLDTL